jgi:ATP-dependent Clp protease protease subunit
MLNVRSLVKAHQIAVKYRASIERPKALMVQDDAQAGTLYLYDQIGGDCFNEGIMAKDVVAAIEQMKAKGCKTLNVRIASEGGDVFEGKAIYEALKRCNMDTVAFNDSIAASAASFIAMGCKRSVSAPQATWMIHRAWSMALGNAEDLRDTANILEIEDRNIAAMYAEKTGKTPDECLALMSAESWFNAEQAKALGFADEIARDDDGGDSDGDSDGESASAKAVIKLAAVTQERIRSARAKVTLTEQELKISHHTRASPGSSNPQRPAAR